MQYYLYNLCLGEWQAKILRAGLEAAVLIC